MKYFICRKVLKIKTIQEKRVEPWFRADGDRTHRLDYNDLTPDSIVFDLGGFVGQWASDIYSKYNCTVYVFEPVAEYAEKILQRFRMNPKIHVFNFGLDKENKIDIIGIDNDASSLFKTKGKETTIQLKRAIDFIESNKIDYIDLMKINIEGGEFDLLEHLINVGFIDKIKNIQIQFHDFVPNAEKRMKTIQNKLSLTHQITFQYEFVWENWKIKE